MTILLSGCTAQPEEYDFIIVGGGAAGCLLADRLSEVSEWNVLLIEAGGEENFLQDIPALASLSYYTPANWGYKTEKSSTACLGLIDGRCNWPRGKVLGGTTVLNYMVYTRGNRKDYDGWKTQGCEGWGYDDVLPYFLRSENMRIPTLANDKKYHSTEGELFITRPPYHTQIASDFVEAGPQAGYKDIDYNAATQIGFSFLQATMKNGERMSSNRAFLKPARQRKNLHVVNRSLVTKILIDPQNKTAYGVEYKYLGIFKTEAVARKEVILSAGAINSPQLLMLSGIGPKEHLQKVGVPVIQDLRVGFNLQDHISLGTLFFTANSSVTARFDNIPGDAVSLLQYLFTRNGTLTMPGAIEALAFLDIDDSDGLPEIELIFAGTTVASLLPVWFAWGGKLEIYAPYMSLAIQNAFSIFPILLHPKSRGWLTLKDKNPETKPLLYHNYLTEKQDVEILVKGIKRAIQLIDTEAFQRHGVKLYTVPLPPCKSHEFGSDAYWECSIRYMTFTVWHQCGTCKMGPDSDPDAVVDPQLKVRGIRHLRVVDTSIIPVIPAAHLTAPAYMIAEKAADMIKQEWKANA
ncbi:Glucose dehydrogenase [FAD, quinone] [Cryptotermes secundus]|nr:Glucose dehydrogenase [FAD, quinone] [Cryptotermes secundus]